MVPATIRLIGGSGGDLLFGQSGNDTLLGKGGNDLLFGGAGNDVLTGGTGNDQVFGEAGDDRMIWNPGDGSDLFEGGDGNDTAEVNGGNGAEIFTITANGTRVRFDRLNPAPFSLDIGTTENLVLNANGGDDTITAGNGLSGLIQLTLDGGAGNDTITGGDGNDTLIGGDGNDLITGGRGSDMALLGTGNDTFVWNPGDGSDVVEGQDGTDTLLFNGANIEREHRHLGQRRAGALLPRHRQRHHGHQRRRNHPLQCARRCRQHHRRRPQRHRRHPGADRSRRRGRRRHRRRCRSIPSLSTAPMPTMSSRCWERRARSRSSDCQRCVSISHAEAGDQLVIKTAGWRRHDQRLHAAGWNHELTIDGGAGNDTITGSQGDDMLLGGDGNDIVDGGRGNDTALLGNGDDTFVWNPGDGSDIVEGEAGTDTLLFNGANISENIDISANGSRVPIFRDVGNVTMDLNGVEHIEFAALAAPTQITVNDLTGTDVNQVAIDLAATPGSGQGDGQPDTVIVNGTAGDDNINVATMRVVGRRQRTGCAGDDQRRRGGTTSSSSTVSPATTPSMLPRSTPARSTSR